MGWSASGQQFSVLVTSSEEKKCVRAGRDKCMAYPALLLLSMWPVSCKVIHREVSWAKYVLSSALKSAASRLI